MKIIITERQLNELMSLDNYDAKTFISNRVIGTLKEFSTMDGSPTDEEMINDVTNSIINSVIEFYEIDNTLQNRKKINSLFHVYYNVVNLLQLHIHNREKDFKVIYREGVGVFKTQIFEDRIVEMISKLIDELKKKYPEWVEGGEFKKEKILPYKNTPFQSDDELSVGIYEWNVTFDTLEKLFYDFLFENLEDVEYEKYKTIIDRNMDRLKDYVEKDDYKKHIYYNKPISDAILAHKISKRMIKVLGQDKIYDKKYLYDYIYSLHDFGIEMKLFDKDFIDFLVMFRKFVMK
jgi:hypothetical protein